MSGETEERPSGWTVDTLKAFLVALMESHDLRYEQRFEGQEKAVRDALQAAKEAVTKAEVAAEKRFDSVNEFRQTLSDQARDLMPRLETEQAIRVVNDKVAALTGRVELIQSNGAGLQRAWAFIASAVAVIAAVVTIGVVLATR